MWLNATTQSYLKAQVNKSLNIWKDLGLFICVTSDLFKCACVTSDLFKCAFRYETMLFHLRLDAFIRATTHPHLYVARRILHLPCLIRPCATTLSNVPCRMHMCIRHLWNSWRNVTSKHNRLRLLGFCREVGGWGRVPFSRNLMSPTPRRKWYSTTGRRAH